MGETSSEGLYIKFGCYIFGKWLWSGCYCPSEQSWLGSCKSILALKFKQSFGCNNDGGHNDSERFRSCGKPWILTNYYWIWFFRSNSSLRWSDRDLEPIHCYLSRLFPEGLQDWCNHLRALSKGSKFFALRAVYRAIYIPTQVRAWTLRKEASCSTFGKP